MDVTYFLYVNKGSDACSAHRYSRHFDHEASAAEALPAVKALGEELLLYKDNIEQVVVMLYNDAGAILGILRGPVEDKKITWNS